MSDQLLKLKTSTELDKSTELLTILNSYDRSSLDVFTEYCVNFSDEQFSNIIEITEAIKRRTWLYQWAIIATKAYILKQKNKRRIENKEKRINIGQSLSKAFPMWKKSSIYNKILLWDTFYQDPEVEDRAKWGGQEYPIIENLSDRSEIWFLYAKSYSDSKEEALENIKYAEEQIIEHSINNKNYNPILFLKHLSKTSKNTNIKLPFLKYRNVFGHFVSDLEIYLENTECSQELTEEVLLLLKQSEFLQTKVNYLSGNMSRIELKEYLKNNSKDLFEETGNLTDIDVDPL